MIKIKWADRSAVYDHDKGKWESNNKSFENALNVIAIPSQIKGYAPDIQEALIELAKEQYKDLEILEITTPKRLKLPNDVDY